VFGYVADRVHAALFMLLLIGTALPTNWALADDVAHARVWFRKHEYRRAILALEGKRESLDAKWLMAESLFRLHLSGQAALIFKEIYRETTDKLDKIKAALRLLEIAILSKDVRDALGRFRTIEKEWKSVPGRLSYALGKTLYDLTRFSDAQEVFNKVNAGDEYFMRARYIMATMQLGKVDIKTSLQSFNQIEKTTPVATEDYWVHELAILAQGRILSDLGEMALARDAYLRVPVEGAFGAVAYAELLGGLLFQSDQARLGLGRFKDMAPEKREALAKSSLESAGEAIFRYRKKKDVTIETPELFLAMAETMVKDRRYDDARLAYDKLIHHFRPIRASLLSAVGSQELWPYFAVDYRRDERKTSSSLELFQGLPWSLVRELSLVSPIITMRDRIEESGKKLMALERDARIIGVSPDALSLTKMRAAQIENEQNYRTMALSVQKELSAKVASILASFLSQAEFNRAELVSLQMRDLAKQRQTIHDFTTRNIDVFDEQLKALDAGGKP